MKKLIVTEKKKKLKSVTVDPLWMTADVDVDNNHYSREIIKSRIEGYKEKKREGLESKDIMHDYEKKEEEAEEKKYKK